MAMLRSVCAFVLWAAFFSTALSSEDIRFSEAADWVLPSSIPKPNAKYEDAPAQFLSIDRQDYFGPEHVETYFETAVLIQSPEGLSSGNIAIPWQAETDILTVHKARILRGDEEIDILAQGQEFTVLRRELNLELSILDGVSTAVLQPQGLRIGDIVRLAYTVRLNNPVLKNRASLILPALTAESVQQVRIRQVWPDDRDVRWQTTPDLPKPEFRKTRHGSELRLELKDVEPPKLIVSAPARYYMTATLELTEFKDWADIAELLQPLFEEASVIDPSFELKKQADEIARRTRDKKRRAEMALRLVQEQLRYVYVALGTGGYIPLQADDAWSRRYGDCKAKTVVLVALLRALGIDAEPALVSTFYGDGMHDRLPVIGLFDHIIVRAEIDGQEYWLDGTRMGDMSLDRLIAPPFQWALPLRQENATLMRVAQPMPTEPFGVTDISIDASNGFSEKTDVVASVKMYGDAATLYNAQINSLTAEQRKTYLEGFWALIGDFEDIEADAAYDRETGYLRHTLSGKIDFDWTLQNGRQTYRIPNAGLGLNGNEFDAGDDERSAPWALPFPFYERARTVIKLPGDGEGFTLDGGDFNLDFEGVQIRRRAVIEDGELVMERSIKITQPELSVEDGATIAELFSGAQKKLRFYRSSNALMTTLELERMGKADLVNAEQYIDRGLVYMQQDKFDEAVSDFDRAVELAPDNSWAYANRGMSHFWRENYGSARRDFDNALELESENWVALQGEGMLFAMEQKFAQAIERFDRAIDINPAGEFARSRRAMAYMEVGRTSEALSEIETLVQEFPEDHFFFFLQSSILAYQEDWENALDSIAEAISLMPEEVAYYSQRSEIYEEMQRTDEALADLDTLVELAGADSTVFNNRCWFRATRKMQLKKALDDCNRAIELDPYSAPALDSRALVFMQMGQLAKAIENYDAALSLSPNMAQALYGRGIARLKRGDEKGQADIDRAQALRFSIKEEFTGYGISPVD